MTQFGNVLLVVSGRLAEAYGPGGAFAVAVGAAAAALLLALTTRVPAARGHSAGRAFIPARQIAPPQAVAVRAEAPREVAPRSA
ncbi:hypothetical protein ACFV2Q_05760 [Streptomyces sp. NPDC059650]|uniref:hypothetical protein n=1 Tax=Streptomyces sp. NPDC059650 TaxID=3346896 RepID=UPI0036CED41C